MTLSYRAAVEHTCPDTCELCGGPPDGRWGTLSCDHDHPTGVLRGWLCSTCNMAIGCLGDDLDRAIEMLIAYRESRGLLQP